jgi:hypothetical protein
MDVGVSVFPDLIMHVQYRVSKLLRPFRVVFIGSILFLLGRGP